MGRIKYLRDKVKAGEATEEEKEELQELQDEAKEDATEEESTEEESTEEESTDETTGETTEETSEEDVDKQIKKAAAKFMELVGDNAEKAKDERKSKVMESGKQEIDYKSLTGKKRTGEFIRAMISGAKEKLQVMSGGTAADGGFLVPEEWANEIVQNRLDRATIRSRARVIQISTDTFHLPQLATRPKVFWTAEAATKNTSTVTFSEITLTPYTLAVIVVMTNQLIADATVGLNNGIIGLVTDLIVDAIIQEEDDVFINGNGTGRPTGIDNYALTTVNAANNLSGDHLISAFYRLGQGYRTAGAIWLMNSRTISAVKGLKDSNNAYLFTGALESSANPTLLGAPVIENNFVASSKIFFGDLSQYWIAEREGISVKVSDEAVVASISMFERNETAVRVEERIDAELADTQAFVEISNTGVS